MTALAAAITALATASGGAATGLAGWAGYWPVLQSIYVDPPQAPPSVFDIWAATAFLLGATAALAFLRPWLALLAWPLTALVATMLLSVIPNSPEAAALVPLSDGYKAQLYAAVALNMGAPPTFYLLVHAIGRRGGR